MAQESSKDIKSSVDASQVDPTVLSGEACIKCGFKCIEGCT